jgi:hypothetical protein
MKWDTNWDADKKKRTAIGSLNHAVRFHWDGEKITWAEDNTEKIPTDAEIDAEVIRLQANWIATEYSRARASEYLPIGDQLDMQYKDLINGTTTWKDHVAKVKSDNPKG